MLINKPVCGLDMSHNSGEEAHVEPASDSFWEPGQFKRTTKRIESGNSLCNELNSLLQDRANIEKEYAASLRKWSKKWNDVIEKGPEYGTMEAAWKGVLAEADRVSDVHDRIKESLSKDIAPKLKDWQREHFHKTMVTQIKEKKEKDDEFRKKQKTWAKLWVSVERCRKEYHMACKRERSALVHSRNADGDMGQSPDAISRMRDKVDQAKHEVARTKDSYEAALREINDENSRYMEDMTTVFDKCQDMEAQRLNFFKEILFQVHQSLNISGFPELPQIYEELHHTISNSDAEKDLRWWSNNHGVNMPMNWPRFEEYVEEHREIASKKNALKLGRNVADDPNITLITQRAVTDELPDPKKNKQPSNKASGKVKENNAVVGSADLRRESPKKSHQDGAHGKAVENHVSPQRSGGEVEASTGNGRNANGRPTSGGYDDEWDNEDDGLEDHDGPGVPVRALYDYEGVEEDELSFKTGDVFEKLEEEDDQGWCKGRKDQRVGLYPANYVEVIR